MRYLFLKTSKTAILYSKCSKVEIFSNRVPKIWLCVRLAIREVRTFQLSKKKEMRNLSLLNIQGVEAESIKEAKRAEDAWIT